MKKLILHALMIAFLSCIPAIAADYVPVQCPVVGNKSSKIYHVPGGQSYAKMLKQNQKGDNRQCFQTEQAAQSAGYRRSKR
jgi:hypothetical protein